MRFKKDSNQTVAQFLMSVTLLHLQFLFYSSDLSMILCDPYAIHTVALSIMTGLLQSASLEGIPRVGLCLFRFLDYSVVSSFIQNVEFIAVKIYSFLTETCPWQVPVTVLVFLGSCREWPCKNDLLPLF